MSIRNLFILALFSLALRAQDITVQVRTRAFIQILFPAEAAATKIFAKIGVGVVWPHESDRRPVDARQQVEVEIHSSARENIRPQALAYAVPSDRKVHIFYDRVMASAEADLRTVLLAHVLVHEITHVIEGVNWHADDGLMKAHWSHADIVGMVFRPLAFDPLDVALIHRRLAADQDIARQSASGVGEALSGTR